MPACRGNEAPRYPEPIQQLNNSTNMKPETLWNYFFEILKIPHASGKEEQLRNYIIDLAQQHNLEYSVDKVGNFAQLGFGRRRTIFYGLCRWNQHGNHHSLHI